MININSSRLFLFLFIILSVTSCVYENLEDCKQSDDIVDSKLPGDVYLNLNLSVLSPFGTSKTRADEINDSNYFELTNSQYEKIHTLRVIIVRGERTTPISYVRDSTGYIEHNHLFTLDSLGTVQYDDMVFKVRAGEKKQIYFIINEAFIKDNSYLDFDDYIVDTKYNNSLETFTFSRLGNTKLPMIDNHNQSKKYYIPMSEKFEIDVPVPQHPGDYALDKSFFVTRAAVKFSFIVNLKSDFVSPNFYVKDITVYSLATEEYLLPREVKYSDLITDTHDSPNIIQGMFIQDYKIPNSPDSSFIFRKEFPEISDVNGSKKMTFSPAMYFPESKPNTDYYVSITIADKASTDTIVLPPAKLNNLPSLPRNTHVVVNLNINSHDLQAEAVVFPYTGVILNPEFGFIIPVESIELSIASKDEPVTQWECREGEEFNMIASVLPINANNKDLVWESSDENIATVTSFGLVNGLKEGTAVITVKSVDNPEAMASCTVTVKPKIPVTGLSLSPSTWRDNIGESVRLSADLLPTDATIQDIIWESSNTDIAAVSSYGIVTAVSPGDAVITAKAADNPSISATCTVTVNPKVHVTSISISAGPSGTFYEGNQFSLAATVSPLNATDKGITWTSSDNSVATVTSYGLVTAKSPGTTTITATSTDDPSKSSSRTITVTAKIPVTGITLTRGGQPVTSWTTTPGTRRDVRATITPANATYGGVVWQSSDVTVATLVHISTGDHTSVYYVNAVGKGTATITASSYDNPDVKVEYKVTVN